MWSRTCLWKHEAIRDVAMDVYKSFYIPEKDMWKLTVYWWDVGSCHKPRFMGEGTRQKLEIKGSDVRKWKRVNYDEKLMGVNYVFNY